MKIDKRLVLGLGGLALLIGVGAVASSGEEKLPPKPDGPKGLTNSQWQDYMRVALNSRDPKVMRTAAEVMRKAGMTTEAELLETTASAIDIANQAAEAANKSKPAQAQPGKPAPVAKPDPVVVQTPGVVQQAQAASKPAIAKLPPALQKAASDALAAAAAAAKQAQQTALGASSAPATPVPTAPPSVQSKAPDPRAIAAEGLASYLKSTSRYKEDRSRVRAFQQLVGQKPDGLYGVGTGLEIARQGVVPARPYYYSKNKTKAASDKRAWKAAMASYAAKDPSRRVQWDAAAAVDRD